MNTAKDSLFSFDKALLRGNKRHRGMRETFLPFAARKSAGNCAEWSDIGDDVKIEIYVPLEAFMTFSRV